MKQPRPYANPYLAGVGIGLVLLAAFVLVGRGLGASGAFSTVVASSVRAVAPAHGTSNAFYDTYAQPLLRDWLVLEVFGIVLGAVVSAAIAGRLHFGIERGPGITNRSRLLFAFAGGSVMGIGAKLARGCTSGLGITGGALLSVGSWLFVIAAFAAAYAFRAHHAEVLAMRAPLYDFGAFGDGTALALALPIGFAFGWFLEHGGLGNAKKLAGQFYFTDLTVFKVMFSAIVTAALGVFWLSRIGWLDLGRIAIPPTYILPQIAGGLVFGAGFVIGGLCPGTSCVAAATGRADGLALIAGMLVGVFGFGELLPRFSAFYDSTSRGALTLNQAFHLSYGVTVFLLVAIALAMFVGAEAIERRGGSRIADRGSRNG